MRRAMEETNIRRWFEMGELQTPRLIFKKGALSAP
jgi:hypothetical protein